MAQKRTLKNGKTVWVGRYRDTTGKEHSKSFRLEREAKAWEADQRRAIARGEWIDPATQGVTVGELVDDYIRRATKPGTVRDRKILCSNLGDLADMPLHTVRRSDLEEWAMHMRDGRPWADDKPLAPTTVQVKVGQLRTVFGRAVDDGLLVKNPAVVLKRFPVGEREPFYVPTDKEIRDLYDAPKPEWFRLALRLGAEAGLRAGEVGGLRVKDVDFMRRVIHVRVQSPPGKAGEVVALKSASSRRDVPISEGLALDLSTALAGRDVGPEGRVLLGEWGRPLYSARISHLMADTRTAAGVDKRVHFHSLRHLFASRLLALGVDLPTVSGLLGHSNVAVTARVYSHQLPGRERVARDAMDRLAGFLWDSAPDEGAESG